MKRFFFPPLLCLLIGWCWIASPEPAAGAEKLVDRIVAIVDEDPIFLSDIERIIGLGLAQLADGETAGQLRRRVLDGLVEQRLRFHEVDRYDFGPLPLERVESSFVEIRSGFSDPTAFEERLVQLGLSEAGLKYLLTRQLRVLIYIEERLTPRVFVDPEDVRDYYERVLSPRAASEDFALPPLADVQEEIREILSATRLNEQIQIWTDELRLQAEIVDHLDVSPQPLPPVVRRVGPTG